LAVITLVVFTSAGCASVPKSDPATDALLKTFATKPDVAGIYVYGDERMGIFNFTNVEIDGEPFGQNSSHTYLYAEVAPGRHSVASKAENTDTIEFDVEGGALYFVRQEVKAGWFTPRTKLHLVSDAEGQNGVRGARLVEATHRSEDQRMARIVAVSGVMLIPLLILLPGIGAAALLVATP